MTMTSQSYLQHVTQVTDAHAAVVAQFSQTVATWCDNCACLHGNSYDDDDGDVDDW